VTTGFVLRNVEFIPEALENGVLYVSRRFRTATHLCACGCKSEVVTSLGPTRWQLSAPNGRPTLYPSIGNWSLACHSHYFIRDGAVIWATQLSDAQIAAGRRADRQAMAAYHKELSGWQWSIRDRLSDLLVWLQRITSKDN
jgi:hypothetical protein